MLCTKEAELTILEKLRQRITNTSALVTAQIPQNKLLEVEYRLNVCRKLKAHTSSCIQHSPKLGEFLRQMFEIGRDVARMGESRNAYRVLDGILEGKRPLGRPKRRWKDNIKMDLTEVGYDDRKTVSSQFTARLSWLLLLAQSLAFTESRTPDLQRRSAELRTQVPQLRSTALELRASGSTVTDTTQVALWSRSWLHCYTRLTRFLSKSACNNTGLLTD
ncbi:hypothetical protein ANN_15506 [Periplaneta americana]|uniref:Uncharacterized protein n=1 Tax=Periplaneta americana TaxID=6978 RepID=A0ABQ8SHQ0_PERAM|nr:hypothetical protein ANN_15506 [Periplaneta americana]